MLLQDTIRSAAATRASHVAILCGDETIDYATLDARSDACAALLSSMGVERGDRVVSLLDNSIDGAAALWGILKAGAVVVALGPSVRASRLAAIIRDCTPRVVIASPKSQPTITEAGALVSSQIVWTEPPQGLHNEASLAQGYQSRMLAPSVRQIDGDLAAIIYTSGTTGEPKGVMLTHRNLVNTVGVITRYLGNHSDDVVCSALPHWFSYGLCQVLAAAFTGHTLLLEKSFAFPFQVLQSMARHRATGFPGVPSMFAAMLKVESLKDLDLSRLRYVSNAAAGIPPAHVLRVREALPHITFHSMYGQTECTRALTLDPSLVNAHPQSVGRAIENCDAYLIDDLGRVLPHGGTGELVIRGANVSQGYWNRPEHTAAKFRDGPIPGEKVLHTGDLFRSDATGLFTFMSRTDDVFKCRGEKVAPQMIEHAICEMPEVAEAAVIGIPDAADGLAVKAFVVVREGKTLTEARVRQHCNSRLEAVMVPRFVEWCHELPKTESGKLRRAGLHEQQAAGAGAAPRPTTRGHT